MRIIHTLPLLFVLVACEPPKKPATTESTPATTPEAAPPSPAPAADIKNSLVRVNSTQQSWSSTQPWEKETPRQRRALAAIIGPQRVITTAELVTDATMLEFESPDGNHFAQARVITVDYEANLAILGPVSEREGEILFANKTILEIAAPPQIGQSLDIIQVEDNGVSLITPGLLQSVDIESNFLPDHHFLTFMVKASMQSAASSYSLPVLLDGKLAGVLISYNSKDQICDVAATEVLARFIKGSANGDYKGFPSLGISTARTEDISFRQWLKLDDSQGGLYINSVRKGGAAEASGVKKGDVLLAVNGQSIDRRGYYKHSSYGNLHWVHLVRGEKSPGDIITLSILREGQPLEIKATLTREEESSKLIPTYHFGKAPNFLVKGGLVFQELSRPLLESFGENWQTRAPLPFLDALNNPEKYEESVDRIIFLSGSIPTPATVGYESLRNLIVNKVNGKEIKKMKDLIDAFDQSTEPLHSIEFKEEQFTIYLDDETATTVDAQLLKRGISRLSRFD